MTRLVSRCLSVAAISTLFAGVSPAQSARRGEIEIPAVATGEERTAQSDLYVMDFYAKPLRMIPVEVTDPQTGEKKLEHVWYIVYRAYNRKLARPGYDKPPENELDPEVISPALFVPEFTLQTTDTSPPKMYRDEVIPEALAAIRKREKGKYLDTVDIVGPIPPASDPDDPNREGLWGVAMWHGVDPEADRFTVYMTGFSNGIRTIKGPDGEPVIQTKTIEQKYWRPGDRYDLAEPEIRPSGVSQWIYR